MSFKIDVDSLSHSVNSDKAKLVVNIDPPIKLDYTKEYVVKLFGGKMPYVIPNISASIGNNTMSYQIYDTGLAAWGAVKTITFEDGIYSFLSIQSKISNELINNGDYNPGTTPAEDEYAFELYGNPATGKAYFTAWDDEDVKIDLSNGGASTLHDILGFGTDPDRTITAGGSTIGDTDVDIGGDNSQFYIISNLVDSYGGVQNNVLYSSPWRTNPWSAQVFPTAEETPYVLAMKNVFGTYISNLSFDIHNRAGQLMDFSLATAKDAQVSFSIIIGERLKS